MTQQRLTPIFGIFVIGLLSLALTACQDSNAKTQDNKAAAANKQQASNPHKKAQTQKSNRMGQVVETMDASRYTYLKVKEKDGNTFWAAAPQTKVAKGDQVIVPPGLQMQDYHSKTLDRNFDSILFVSRVLVEGQKQGGMASMASMGQGMGQGMPSGDKQKMPEGHPDIKQADAAAKDISFDDLQKAQNGYTINEIYQQQNNLAGEKVTVRGKVVKYNPNIMDTNWIHIQDGTGEKPQHDLTVTAPKQVSIGDTVLISGVLEQDKDFGYGYQYDLIIQDAKVKVE